MASAQERQGQQKRQGQRERQGQRDPKEPQAPQARQEPPRAELTSSERMTVRFHLGCLATLIPYHQRPAALEAWLGIDPALFFMGFGPPAPVAESVLHLGSTRLRVQLARTTTGADLQRGLLALDDPDIDAALRDNSRLEYGPECVLRLRDPAATAAGRAHHEGHHRRALLSADPELAAAALLDPRGKIPPTARAAAWATVRAAGGTDRVRRLAAALPRPHEPVGAGIVAACAEADPEPFLDAEAERRLGTGALLGRLRDAHRADHRPWNVRRAMESVLTEPYRLDWGLIQAARLGCRLPRTAAELLRARPDCPAATEVILRTGRPARPGSPPPRPVPGPAVAPPYRRARPHWVPAWQPPGSTGPLGDSAEAARRVLRTRPVAYDTRTDPQAVTLDHVAAVIERGQLPACEAAALLHPASLLTSWVGQASGWADVSRAAWSGRAALHVATAALLARWAEGRVPAERWAAFYHLLRGHPGSLPELLDTVTAAHPD
ncbi:hypothetical protein AB0D54_11020 [Streptomyces xanthophaeus]|uniref:hypothetical protein n=1 Tax=Streptomyces xanthophaeus TaxID=67385 RepID=UPI003443E6BE